LGGDFNTDLNTNRKHASTVRDFLKDHNLEYCKLKSDCYTFGNVKRGSYSTIDFWCISSDLIPCISCYESVESALNFSDHLPVKLCLALPVGNVLKDKMFSIDSVVVENSNKNNNRNVNSRLRFDHGNHALFYETSRVLLEPVFTDINSNLEVGDCVPMGHEAAKAKIEEWYDSIVNALNTASDVSIPRVRGGGYKQW
jgi:hypothetical protein